MKKYFIIGFIFLFIGLILGSSIISLAEKSPEQVINSLEGAIEKAEKEGKYKCCIEPACTMCYLGHWKFEKGTCYCDYAIAEGRDDDVCPECRKGLKNGECSSVIEEEFCELEG